MARHRQHVNPLKMSYLARAVRRIDLPAGRDVEVELGCADAQFLFERSAARPEVVPIGIEIREDVAREVNARARLAGSPVRAVFAHANVDFGELFAPATLARVYVNFPDPWFKRRHHKRRVMEAGLGAALAAALRPDGELFFQSDVWGVALDALAVLEDEPGFRNRAGSWSFWKDGNPYGVRSRRETICEAEGRSIWRLLYGRVSEPPARAIPAP